MFPGDADCQLYAVDAATGAPVAGFPLSIPDPAPVAGQQMYGRGPAVSSPMKIGNLVVVQLRRQTMVANGDGSSTVTMRESVVGIDPEAARIVWQHALATKIVATGNGVPELNMCATPAGFAGGSGGLLVDRPRHCRPRSHDGERALERLVVGSWALLPRVLERAAPRGDGRRTPACVLVDVESPAVGADPADARAGRNGWRDGDRGDGRVAGSERPGQ